MASNGNSSQADQNGQTTVNPFDPAALRLDQSFVETAGVKKLLTTVPVRRPNRQDFFRVNPDPSYRLSPAGIVELKEDRETYLVTPNMAKELDGEFSAATLFTAITRQKVLFIWAVKLPGSDGKSNPWHQSAAEAAELAMRMWIRIGSNMHVGAYEIFKAERELAEPEWPGIQFPEILKIAFRDRIVDTPDHPLVKRLKGLA
jgi:hypothetical protein